MDLGKNPLKIQGKLSGTRIVDSLYKAGDEYYFLDIGWKDAATHPCHYIGKLVKETDDSATFKGEDEEVFVITEIEDEDVFGDDLMLAIFRDWKNYLKENPPNHTGPEFVQRDYELDELPETINNLK